MSEHDTPTRDDAPRAADSTLIKPNIPTSIPKQIGQFHLKRLIASGGMGAVYEAMQEKPRRTVAVKVMKQGLTSRSALRRFEYESQILARLRHPGIAQIFDAGTHDDGSGGVPYFVMEYIPNARPITEHAQLKKLSMRERLDLFAQVCAAVHHGHQKGIIHRDLKPANILVDSDGQVKIIDFGVAKATDSDLAVTTLQTDVGQLIGTIQYMSPEQVEADPHDIDTRSDVYALGIVLYELLTERLPYDVSTVAVYEAARVIREQLPARLSSINRMLRGDLETITLKALEKNRDRRYQSAVELGQDLQRYLKHEPIAARPPSLVYQFQTFTRRHRTAFAATVIVFLALVLGIIGTGWGMVQANRQSVIAIEAQGLAEREADKANAVSEFLKGMLSSVDPRKAQGREVTVREVLEEAASMLNEFAPGDPELQSDLRSTIGSAYRSIGRYAEAEIHQRTATDLRQHILGAEHPTTLTSMIELALILDDMGKKQEAEKRLRDLVKVLPRVMGADHSETLRAQNNLAWLLQSTGRPAEAEPLFARCVDGYRDTIGEQDPMTIKCIANLGGAILAQGRIDEAEPHIDEAVRLANEHLGPLHPDTLHADSYRAWLLGEQLQIVESIEAYRSVLKRAIDVMGETHPHYMFWANSYAWALSNNGEHGLAAEQAKSLLDTRSRVLGDDHPSTISSYQSVGTFLYRDHAYESADEFYRTGLTLATDRYGADHFTTLTVHLGFTWNLLFLQRYEATETNALECLEGFRKIENGNGTYAKNVMNLLITLYDNWDKPDEAQKWRDEQDAANAESG